MATTSAGDGGGGLGRRRPRHQRAARRHRVEFSLSGEEFAVVRAAAQDAGLACGAFAAQAVVAAAGGEPAGEQTELRQALAELIRASGLVRRIGVNLNQAVARLNATGQHAGDLRAYAAEGMRRAERLDDAAEQVRKALR